MSDSDVDPQGLRIRDLGAGEFDENDEPLLPHLSEFLKDIRLRLGAADEALGRRYQREIVDAGALEIISPLSGRRTSATESILVLGKNFYRFCESREFYVAAARVKFGYPLLALFVPDANILVKWEIENSKRGIEPKHVAALKTLVEEQGRAVARRVPEPVTIVMGHQNFAHHLWNELPALERLLADLATDRTPRLLVMREPLGPIDRLFPEVAGWKIERLRGRSPSVANGNGKLFVNLGSYCVTSSIRERILSHAKTSASTRARELEEKLRTSNVPVFWVSVRMQSPTLTNQREVLAELGSQILQYFPACMVLFDGFSLPEDWDQCEDDDVRFYRAAAHESKKEIDAIIADITGNRLPSMSQQFVNLGGLGILDCIATAALATCYFCHVGTVQHKIGWTTSVPGMIHANRRIISGKSAVWHAPSRLENGVLPEAVPPRMVTGAGKEEDYRILDTIGVAKTVCEFFQHCASAKFRA